MRRTLRVIIRYHAAEHSAARERARICGVPLARYVRDVSLGADWLKSAYRKAGIEKEPGSLWHALRRKWGHDRQNCPTLETMHAGGWKDFETFRRCYRYPDSDTMQAVADLVPIPERRTQNVHTSWNWSKMKTAPPRETEAAP